jgi:hypothetical protein
MSLAIETPNYTACKRASVDTPYLTYKTTYHTVSRIAYIDASIMFLKVLTHCPPNLSASLSKGAYIITSNTVYKISYTGTLDTASRNVCINAFHSSWSLFRHFLCCLYTCLYMCLTLCIKCAYIYTFQFAS